MRRPTIPWKVCVLIDEYDKPLLSTLGNPELLAESERLEKDACLEEIRRWYNGYRFHPDGPAGSQLRSALLFPGPGG
jgi:hypothetical protein